MEEFLITPAMAAERTDQLAESGNALGLSSNFIQLQNYSPGNKEDFSRYINDNGIKFFSVDEVITPSKTDKAIKAGFTYFTPPIHLWPWSMLVLSVGDYDA